MHPLMDGHPHSCSTDFEQTLLGGHLTRRGVGCHTSPYGYATIFGETGEPALGWRGRVTPPSATSLLLQPQDHRDAHLNPGRRVGRRRGVSAGVWWGGGD